MRRFLLVLSAAALGPAVRADSDDRDREFIPIQIIQVPQNYFSASFNYSGRLTATFNNLGTISSARDIGDTTSEYSRGYDDGYVYKDTRLTGNGEDVPDDGRTNTWSYLYGTQVTEDQRFIAFHTYSAISEGATMEGEASEGAGVDLEYSRQLQSFGRYRFGEEPKLSWGVLAGVTTAGANAKTEGEIT